MSDSTSSERKEDLHKATVTATFDSYLRQVLSANQRRRGDYYMLPEAHRQLLPEYPLLLNKVGRLCCLFRAVLTCSDTGR